MCLLKSYKSKIIVKQNIDLLLFFLLLLLFYYFFYFIYFFIFRFSMTVKNENSTVFFTYLGQKTQINITFPKKKLLKKLAFQRL